MIFPYVEPITEEITEDVPLAKEWAWDFEKNDFLLKNNKMYLVEGLEAVKIWTYKALLTERFKHDVYSWDYGSELVSLIGSGYSSAAVETEARRMIEEALSGSPYINGLTGLEVTFDQETLTIEFVLDTIYGETEVNLNAN
ncbi:DUF2634 domain-containing protein [Robertmurraya korlensis]|uniref:DUF2634 domain-containing protein n=1 Tax=Robertmurraya korlensis TaxID=519977 RepID=UPI00203D3DBC|nr:DUF2634 domain-containing protein [Robertmurraya korlensis]MCM3599399.1 DUF2634 domain-containing protein [Robertmurraya korlensis]